MFNLCVYVVLDYCEKVQCHPDAHVVSYITTLKIDTAASFHQTLSAQRTLISELWLFHNSVKLSICEVKISELLENFREGEQFSS